jgi:hypothetical protein
VEPFPPIAQVQQAGIWTMPLYESLRAKLASDIPKPAVNETDTGLLTVDVTRWSPTTRASRRRTSVCLSPVDVHLPLLLHTGLATCDGAGL